MKLPFVKTSIQIRFSDLDPLGHVSNSVYSQYFDMGRIDFFMKVAEHDEHPSNVVASVHMDMLKEIRFNDEVYVETWCSKKGTKSATLQQYIYANEVLVTKGTLVVVGFDQETRKSAPLFTKWEPTDTALLSHIDI